MLKALVILANLLGFNVHETTTLVVTTFDGQVFAAGTGDTCSDAFKNSVWPDDWREVHCEVAYLVR